MKVVGLDLSLASTGWCVIEDGRIKTGRVESTGHITDSVSVRAMRILDISFRLSTVWRGAGLVMIEAPAFSKQAQAGVHLRAGLWWHVAGDIVRDGVPVAEVGTSALKLYATGKGNAGKDDVLLAVERRWPEARIGNNDEADAFVLAKMGCDHLDQPVGDPVPAAHRKALAKVHW